MRANTYSARKLRKLYVAKQAVLRQKRWNDEADEAERNGHINLALLARRTEPLWGKHVRQAIELLVTPPKWT